MKQPQATDSGAGKGGNTAVALLWIAFGVAAWFTGYQATMAYIIRPPLMSDLVTVKGRIVSVDTPVPRNKHEPYSDLAFKTEALRPQPVPVRHGSIDRATLEGLQGRDGEVRFAGKQPRNRWAFELIVDGRRLLDLDTEIGRVAALRRAAMLWSVACGVVASGLLGLIAWRRRRPK